MIAGKDIVEFPRWFTFILIVNLLFGIVGFLFGIFEVESQWIFTSSIFIFLMLVFLLSSRFFLCRTVLRPIFMGLVLGFLVAAVPFVFLFVTYSIDSIRDSLYWNLGAIGGILLLISLVVYSIFSVLIGIIAGLFLSYKKTNNKVVLIFIILFALIFLISLILLFYYKFDVLNLF